jgi:hypothetical protein
MVETSATMNFLVNTVRCVAPYAKEVLDIRDSLFSDLYYEPTEKSLEEREQDGMQIVYEVGTGCEYLLNNKGKREDNRLILVCLSPMSILKGAGDVWCLAFHDALTENRKTFSKEVSLWKAPQQVKDREMEEDEKSVVFTLGMLLYGIVSGVIPYGTDQMDEINAKKCMGKTGGGCWEGTGVK